MSPDEPIALFMAATGLRWSEAVSLTWPSLPVASSVIHLEGAS